MIDDVTFAKGMAMLNLAFNREASVAVTDVYRSVLAPAMTKEQWESAVRLALQKERFFPTPAVLHDYGVPPANYSGLAGEVYAQIAECYERLTGREREWSPSAAEVEGRWGLAAKNAFLAAGGAAKFEWCDPHDEPFRLKAFREAFVETAKTAPAAVRPALPAGEAPRQIR